jgi:apolipoprotein D and lipocalin family protein
MAIRSPIRRWLAHLTAAALIIPPIQTTAQTVHTVEQVDLARYAGRWHEIASVPNFFQRKCAYGTTAEYTPLPDGTIRVRNSCYERTGEQNAVEGRARIADEASGAKLQVTFLRLFGDWRYWFGGDYWIIGLDPDYRWAVVGHPTRDYGWILAREPALERDVLSRIAALLMSQGYDPCTFRMGAADASAVPPATLCAAASGAS